MTLILRKPWTRQPTSYQPLSEFALDFGLGEGLLPWSDRRVVSSSATIIPTTHGLAHRSAASSAGIVKRQVYGLPSLGTITGSYVGFLVVFRTTTTTANAIVGALGSDSGGSGNTLFNAYLTGTSNVDLTVAAGGAATNNTATFSGVNLNDGRVHSLLVMNGSYGDGAFSGAINVWIDGRTASSSSWGSGPGTGNAFTYVLSGGYRRGGTDGVYTTQGDVDQLGIWPIFRMSMPSAAEGLRLTRNAWEAF